jgi:hypothetical protein
MVIVIADLLKNLLFHRYLIKSFTCKLLINMLGSKKREKKIAFINHNTFRNCLHRLKKQYLGKSVCLQSEQLLTYIPLWCL